MTVALSILAAVVVAASGYRVWRRLRYFLHVFQLEGYKTHEYEDWLRGKGTSTTFRKEHLTGLLVVVAVFALPPLVATIFEEAESWIVAGALLVWIMILGSARRYRSENVKKPLVFTARMQRLTGVVIVLQLAVLAIAAGLSAYIGWPGALLSGLLVADTGAPYLVLAGGVLTRPIENAIQQRFKRMAQARLAERPDLTIIGITGSYGKTSVKFAIAEVLSQRFSVLATPASYNTPMGICKVINNELRASHQFLVLEMGARYPGDIQELCEIAQPDVAVLTAVGLAHLETMGSPEAILQTKSELVRYMKIGGPVVANFDDEGVMTIARSADGPVTTVSTQSPEADIVATDIAYGVDGCRFVVETASRREEMDSSLLGAHNVTNILLSLGVGQLFGLRLRQMKHAVGRLRPVPHRLQLRQEGPVTVIDDSFNSNPVGARSAIEILGQFNSGKRVIVTPGMVELGEDQDKENRDLGRFMADHIDLALLVGPAQTKPIRDGLLAAGFPEQQILVCHSLFEARNLLGERLSAGDTVLYENDLPDQYDERKK